MKIHTVPQGHIDWFKLRMGKVTASELGNLLTPEWKPRTGEMPRSYLYSKVAEAWRGSPLISTGSWATEQGQIREEEAIPWLALENNWDIREGGFIEHDSGKCGCSPDGIVGEGESMFGIECKSPEPANHVRYLMEGELPKAYVAQVHCSLYVTGASHWIFFSYQRSYPAFILRVNRDPEIIASIETAIDKFHADFETAMERLSQFKLLP
jgi:hypothetical protein